MSEALLAGVALAAIIHSAWSQREAFRLLREAQQLLASRNYETWRAADEPKPASVPREVSGWEAADASPHGVG